MRVLEPSFPSCKTEIIKKNSLMAPFRGGSGKNLVKLDKGYEILSQVLE